MKALNQSDMIKSTVEKLSKDIGFEIGTSDDVTQSNLLNGFAKGMANSMGANDLEMQCCYVAEKLTPKTCKVLKALVGFVELKEQD